MPCFSFSEDLARLPVLANRLNSYEILGFAGAKLVSLFHSWKYSCDFEVGEFSHDLKD